VWTRSGRYVLLERSTSNSTSYSLPSTLTPNSNGNLATSTTYSSSFTLTSVTGANGATQSMVYDAFNRPNSATSVDGAVTNYTYTYQKNTQTATSSTDSGGEQDAGTLYPTLVEDTTSNQITIAYQAGAGTGAINSSARISNIADPRATNGSGSYTFNYNTGAIPHLKSAGPPGVYVPGEAWQFTYSTGLASRENARCWSSGATAYRSVFGKA